MKQKKDDNADAVAEQDATFQVLDVATLMKAKGLTTVKALKEELAKLKTLSSYQQFVSGLPQNAIIGTLNTDAQRTGLCGITDAYECRRSCQR